jgi:retron-type reverse transcriptase
MEFAEAGRLFGGTLRTRNRNLRDLLTDEKQLERLGLPVWKSEEDLAQALGISLRELWFFAIHRERERQPHYVTFSIPKRHGGKRLIMAPKRRLKAIQRKLLALLVEKLPVSEHAHAFRRGHSIRTGAEPHVGKRFVLKLDLKDFFPSVTFARVRGLLIAFGYGYPVATTLAVLMTEAERQPVEVDGNVFHVPVGERHCVQGAPTSPGICNALLLRLDHRLAGLARKRGVFYTRYADDLSFSGELDRKAAQQLRAVVEHIVAAEGFVINADKTRLMGKGGRQTVTGVVVNLTLGLSRQERRRLRAMAHRLGRPETKDATSSCLAALEGKLAYLSMLNPQQASRLRLPV